MDFLFHLDFRQGDDISLSEVRACLIDITMRRQLEREVVEIVQEEQRRIGIELHDNLGQQITGMTILAKFMQRSLKEEQSTQVQAMADLLSLIQETAEDVRKLSQQLSPGEVEAGELPGRLQHWQIG